MNNGRHPVGLFLCPGFSVFRRIFAKRRTFQGGVQLPVYHALSIAQPIVSIPTPARIWVPAQQYTEPPAEISITVGEKIRAGQLIARKTKTGAINIHAPTDGEVFAIGV